MNTPVAEKTITGGENHVVIVGGGISGLSAAWYLQQQGISYTILEKADRWGGKVITDHVEMNGGAPFVVEGGPDSFLTQKPWAWQLVRELGLDDRLLGTNDDMRQVFVVKRGKLMPLPDGVLMIVPTKIMPFALSPLISLLGKLRMALDLIIPPKTDGKDETIAEFVERRLGREALDRLAEPLMSGIYNAEAEKQSLLATFPRFRTLEEKYGSLTRGMIQSRKARHKAPAPPSGAATPPTMFVSLKDGTQELIETLRDNLTGDLRLETGVSRIEKTDGGYHINLENGEVLSADAVILATPAFVSADLLRHLAPDAARKLEAIRYVSTGTMSMGFRVDEFNHPLNGFGLVIPRSEDRPVNAITWSSTKFNHRAPQDHILLRVFFGGSRRPDMMEKSDEEIYAISRSELESLMGLTAEPLFHKIYRWHRSNPQYDSGHLEHVDALEAALPDGLYVTGSAYRGIGLPDCIKQAKATAKQVGKRLLVKG